MRSDEDSFVRTDRSIEWVRWELVPWRTADGEIGGIIVFTEVITPRKLAEAALQKSHHELEGRVAERTQALLAAKEAADRASALKTRFLAAASHDLRQPLQAALAYLSVLEPRLEAADKALCDSARQALASTADILNILLDLSELDMGAVRPQIGNFSIGALVDRVISGHRVEADRKGLKLGFAGGQAFARSDPRLIERVLDNLVSNAIRHTSEGEVLVGCERVGNLLRLAVIDTGAGIPAEALDQIFDEYVQLANPARDRRKGLGLGLAIVKQIAEILGHPVEVRSKPGAGSTFTIDVPVGLAPDPGDAAPAETALRRLPSRPVVLFVEDDPIVALSLQMALSDEGFAVHEAGSGEEALDIVRSGIAPDVIVSDYRLPTYDGVEVIRRIRTAMGAQTPAVLVTGDTGLTKAVTELASCKVLYKPVQPEDLARVLASLISGFGQADPAAAEPQR